MSNSFTCTDWLVTMLTSELGASMEMATTSPHDGDVHCDALPQGPAPPSHEIPHVAMAKMCCVAAWCASQPHPQATHAATFVSLISVRSQ